MGLRGAPSLLASPVWGLMTTTTSPPTSHCEFDPNLTPGAPLILGKEHSNSESCGSSVYDGWQPGSAICGSRVGGWGYEWCKGDALEGLDGSK